MYLLQNFAIQYKISVFNTIKHAISTLITSIHHQIDRYKWKEDDVKYYDQKDGRSSCLVGVINRASQRQVPGI